MSTVLLDGLRAETPQVRQTEYEVSVTQGKYGHTPVYIRAWLHVGALPGNTLHFLHSCGSASIEATDEFLDALRRALTMHLANKGYYDSDEYRKGEP